LKKITFINEIIIGLLCIILLGIILGESGRRRQTAELTTAIDALGHPRLGIAMLQQDISDLYEAENSFRLYTVTYDRDYFYSYTNGLKKIRMSLDSLRRSVDDSSGYLMDSASLDNAFARKMAINQMIVDLKQATDLALIAAMQLDSTPPPPPHYYKTPVQKIRHQDTTLITQNGTKRKGLFARVKSAFSKTNDRDTITIQKLSATSIERDSAIRLVNHAIKSAEDYYRNLLKDQLAGRNLLNTKDRELVLLNFSLIHRLGEMLDSFRVHEQEHQDLHKRMVSEIARRSAGQLSRITFLSLGAILLLLLLVGWNVYQVRAYAGRLSIARQIAEQQSMAKSNLMASVSHEIRNPLTVIRGFVGLLDNSPLPDPQREQVSAVRQASDMLLLTVNNILDFSKLEAGKMTLLLRPFQPINIVREVLTMMRPLAEKEGLALSMDTTGLSPDLTVIGDAFRLKQVLINLIGNAIKFTAQGTVSLKSFDTAATQHTLTQHTLLHFEVADTGIGIPAGKLRDVFDEFEQADPGHDGFSGTGLGLAICKKIVHLHGGSIAVRSEPGKGSVFSVAIDLEIAQSSDAAQPAELAQPSQTIQPSQPPDAAQPAQSPRPPQPATPHPRPGVLKNKRVLLIDDNPLILQLVLFLLQRQEAIVTIAEEGIQAWTLFEASPFDFVITDIDLPGISGTAIARKIRRLPERSRSRIPIIAITGDLTDQDIKNYRAAGIDETIGKPFNEEELLAKLQRFL
jgi:two-component system, sensor histidine kinase